MLKKQQKSSKKTAKKQQKGNKNALPRERARAKG